MGSATNALKNVVTKLGSCKQVEELRFLVSPHSSGSKGLREFIETAYVDMKKKSPLCPILVREHGQAEATIVARFDKGRETKASVENLERDQVAETLGSLIEGAA